MKYVGYYTTLENCPKTDKRDFLSSLMGIKTFTTSGSFIVTYIESIWVCFTTHVNIPYIVTAKLCFANQS